MARRVRSVFQAVGEINLTPMLDFAFLLLTVFLMTYPLLEQGVQVNLPRGQAAELKPDRSHTVSVRLDGTLYLDNRSVTEPQLGQDLRRLGRGVSDLTVYVRADRDLRYSRVMDIMRLIHDAGIGKMALVSQAE